MARCSSWLRSRTASVTSCTQPTAPTVLPSGPTTAAQADRATTPGRPLLGVADLHFEVAVDAVGQHVVQDALPDQQVAVDQAPQHVVDGLTGRPAEQVVQPGVAVGQSPLGVDLEDADRQRLGQQPEQLFLVPDRLVSRHFLGDVDDVGEHAAVVRVVQQVGVGDFDPEPAAVAAPVP